MVFDPRIRAGIFAGESGGDYDALFGFSNRPGRRFGNVRLTDMTVDQALNFANPSGPYGQWVKGQIGHVATPMGGYQVIGSTLAAAKKGLRLSGNERMTPETQDRIGQWVLEKQGTGAWAGYRGPRDPSPAKPSPLADPAIADFVKSNPQPGGYGPEVEGAVFGSMAPGGGAGSDSLIGGAGGNYNGMSADEANAIGGLLGGDNRDKAWGHFAKAGEYLDSMIPEAPRVGGGGGGGDARKTGNALLEALTSGTVADALLKRRLGFLNG